MDKLKPEEGQELVQHLTHIVTEQTGTKSPDLQPAFLLQLEGQGDGSASLWLETPPAGGEPHMPGNRRMA